MPTTSSNVERDNISFLPFDTIMISAFRAESDIGFVHSQSTLKMFARNSAEKIEVDFILETSTQRYSSDSDDPMDPLPGWYEDGGNIEERVQGTLVFSLTRISQNWEEAGYQLLVFSILGEYFSYHEQDGLDVDTSSAFFIVGSYVGNETNDYFWANDSESIADDAEIDENAAEFLLGTSLNRDICLSTANQQNPRGPPIHLHYLNLILEIHQQHFRPTKPLLPQD